MDEPIVPVAEVAERVDRLRRRLSRAGGSGVSIVAVTKGFGVSAIEAAVACGITQVGENYAQEAIPKVQAARAQGLAVEVHFIGRLQSNKVRALAPVVDVWQTLDRTGLVAAVAQHSSGSRVLVQVNATGEPNKGGSSPEEVPLLVEAACAAGLVVEGLMTVGPTDGDPQTTRAAFRLTRRLADSLGLAACSMGMSADLEIAVDEGSTMIRVGSALFGERPRRTA